MSSRPAASSSSSTDSKDSDQKSKKRTTIWWNSVPSIKIIRPAQGRFSPSVDERCFTYCTQSIRGRLERSEPSCRTIFLRHVFPHEIQRTTTHDGKRQDVRMKFPLPPEGQRTSSSNDTATGKSLQGKPIEVQHWDEGWYIWSSNSRWAAQERIDLMMCDLERQTEWQKYKEDMNEKWAQHMGQTNPSTSGQEGPENLPATPSQPSDVEHAIPQKPFPDLGDESFLIPLPFTPYKEEIDKLLAPTHKVLGLVYETVSSGQQWGFAKRVWEKAWTPEPFVLARNVCSKMWEKWKDGPPDGSSNTKV